jgi:hypothetical protein
MRTLLRASRVAALVALALTASLTLASGAFASAPPLVGAWNFTSGSTADTTGNWSTFKLHGSASLSSTGLIVNGTGNGANAASAWGAASGYSGPALTNKTLVAWVRLDSTSVVSGSPLALFKPSGDRFDAIVYAEQNAGQWMAGSDHFNRTSPFPSGIADTWAPDGMRQVAVSYSGSGSPTISGCLNGKSLGSYSKGIAESFSSSDNPMALFGPRHLGGGASGAPVGSIAAHIAEARVYAGAMTCADVAAIDRTPSLSTVGQTTPASITPRAVIDTASNFTILDTTATAPKPGTLTSIDYYAQATGTVRFVVADPSNKIQYVSPALTVSRTGSHTYTLPSPVTVGTGDRIGYHTAGTGVIPFDWTTARVSYSPVPGGVPALGSTMTIAATDGRTYSLGARYGAVPDTGPSVVTAPASVSGWVGQTLTTSGRFVSSDGSALTVSASVGSATVDPYGNLSWSHTPMTGHSGPVTITARDTRGRSATTTFTLSIPTPAISLFGATCIAKKANGQLVNAVATATNFYGLVRLTAESAPGENNRPWLSFGGGDFKGAAGNAVLHGDGAVVPAGQTMVWIKARVAWSGPMYVEAAVPLCDTTPPLISSSVSSPPAPTGWYAIGSANPTVSWMVSDPESGILSQTGCTPATVDYDTTGTAFTCSATSTGGTSTATSETIRRDTVAPVLSVPAPITLEATGPDGAAATFAPTASDATSGAGAVECNRASGSLFAIGLTSVTCRVSDLAGNVTNATFSVVVEDTTAPTLSDVADETAEAIGPDGAPVAFDEPTATDLVDGTVAVDCTRSPGATFALGSSTVTCTATDEAGNTGSTSFTVLVRDTSAPVIAVSDRSAEATKPEGADVDYEAAATDAVDGAVAVSCAPASGATFAFGTTEVTCSAADSRGNASSATFAVTVVDTTDPTIEGAQDPQANAAGWNRTPVTVTFACADSGTGVAGCQPSQTLAHETLAAGELVHGLVSDVAGNSAETQVGPIRIDLTKPTLSGAATTPPNALGWYRDDVTVQWTAADGLSGVDPDTVPGDSVVTGEGSSRDAGPHSVKDRAGNRSDETSGPTLAIDRTAPDVEAATDRNPNAAGWFDSAVTVRFTCADALSGVQNCPSDQLLDGDGIDQAASGTGTDNADNTASASVAGVRIDSHAPRSNATLDCSQAGGYCNDSATVDVTATDPAPADGVVTSGVASVEYRVGTSGEWTEVEGDSARVDVPLSGSGEAVVEYRAVDTAGNAEPANRSRIDYDTIAPTVSHTLSPIANAAGWSNADTDVRFAATDVRDLESDTAPSGVFSITGDTTVTDETLGRLVEGAAVDNAGNTGRDSVTVRLDRTAPAISAAASSTRGSNGWSTSAVQVEFTCDDPGAVASGIATCTEDRVLQHGETAHGAAEDLAGNRTTASHGPVKVDGDAPAITVRGVADGGIYVLGAVPAASCSADDVGPSGMDGGCDIAVDGGLANGVGRFTYTAAAKDHAGNVETVTGTYSVRYAVKSGTAFWLQPINDTAHTKGMQISVFKAGSTVPAKFQLRDASGNVVQANSTPRWLTPVSGRPTTQPVDEAAYGAAATTGSLFSWSSTERHYQYNWQTPKSGAGLFWRVGVALDDGTNQTISIALR